MGVMAWIALRNPDMRLVLFVGIASLLSAAMVLWASGSIGLTVGLISGLAFATAALLSLFGKGTGAIAQTLEPDWGLIRTVTNFDEAAIAFTDRAGRMRCANDQYGRWFEGSVAPQAMIGDPALAATFASLAQSAWRDGQAKFLGLRRQGLLLDLDVHRTGYEDDLLVWRFRSGARFDLESEARRLLSGFAGERLGEAGIMAALIGPQGHIQIASPVFAMRATGDATADLRGRDFAGFFTRDVQGGLFFAREEGTSDRLRLLQIPADPDNPDGLTLVLLLDEVAGRGETNEAVMASLQAMLAKLPIGLALVDRDGRFLFLNHAFGRAVGLSKEDRPLYPGDLVIREDKAAVADAVRRYAAGQPVGADIAIRLASQPDEPVPLTLASVAGLGEIAVLLSIKDSTEETRLKIQVAQATKMQAVGQLAGGVAHDFNNILTGILGHCDLMLMRHAPGDIDYDDIQQIRNNANRAAGLTRQLLAFSRQQTLRPQILQLPDVVAEISNLLKRLMGEQVELIVKHGRGMGAIRADPGQLEQVIVNLAVNARDAMPDGGRLTIQTYAVSASEVRNIGSDVLPIADYTALSVTDTGTGIPPDLLPKIFEPFFTTKEVGKGTGLGLSTVYGIVKQSGGFIFADSRPGEGASFVLYLPVHHAAEGASIDPRRPKERPTELWGSGTILLVEDEDMVRNVAERALTRHGYDVVTATNGEEGLEVLRDRQDIDLVVSDVVMPVMDGPALGRAARALYPSLPIIFMSGYAEEQLRQSIALDNVEFLPKPFSVQKLAECVRNALPR
ncbi:MAG: ATP-binding protein [Chakrabartia sp.]